MKTEEYQQILQEVMQYLPAGLQSELLKMMINLTAEVIALRKEVEEIRKWKK